MQRFYTQLGVMSSRHAVTSLFHGAGSGGFVLDFHAMTVPWAKRVLHTLLVVRAAVDGDGDGDGAAAMMWACLYSDGGTVDALLTATLCRADDAHELEARRVYRAYYDVATPPDRGEVPRDAVLLTADERRRALFVASTDEQAASRDDEHVLTLAFEDAANRRMYLLVA